MTARSTYVARVKRGAAWLDANKPGWEWKVSLPDFDITSPCRCVLGQIFEQEATDTRDSNDDDTWAGDGFDYGVRLLPRPNLTEAERAVLLGFDISTELSAHTAGDYSILQGLWIEQIEARLAA